MYSSFVSTVWLTNNRAEFQATENKYLSKVQHVGRAGWIQKCIYTLIYIIYKVYKLILFTLTFKMGNYKYIQKQRLMELISLVLLSSLNNMDNFCLVRWLRGLKVVARQTWPADLDIQIPGGSRDQLQKVISALHTWTRHPNSHSIFSHISTQSPVVRVV